MKKHWYFLAVILLNGIVGGSPAMAQGFTPPKLPVYVEPEVFPEFYPPPYSYQCTVYQDCIGGPGGEISVGPVEGTCQVTATGVVVPPMVCPPPSTYNGGIVTPFHQYQLGLPPVFIGIYDVVFGPGGIPIATRR